MRSTGPPRLSASPRAEVLTVADLVYAVLNGQIRIPELQRPWKWSRSDVVSLLDSIYRGYPIGSLLMLKRARPAERLSIGSIAVDAPARSDAWAVIDGQQRLRSLVGTLAREDNSPDDAFAVWFDPETGEFQEGPGNGPGVPVSKLLSGATLIAWWRQQEGAVGANPAWLATVVDLGRRLREYRVPVYVVESDEEAVAREMFQRINLRGKSISERDVFHAMAGGEVPPRRLDELTTHVRGLEMGTLDEHRLLQCVMAVRGLDVTRRMDEQTDKRTVEAAGLRAAFSDTAPALSRALNHLRAHARIPHLRLLPFVAPLIVLTRFFHIFPNPRARTEDLLVRWVWRGIMTRAHGPEERAGLRDAVLSVAPGNDEDAAQRLLSMLPARSPRDWWQEEDVFNARSPSSRLAGLWMASLPPRDPSSGETIDVPALLERAGAAAYQPLVRSDRRAANRFLMFGSVRSLVGVARADWVHDRRLWEILCSHGTFEETVHALAREDLHAAVEHRRRALREGIAKLGHGMAAWNRGDRASIQHLLATQ